MRIARTAELRAILGVVLLATLGCAPKSRANQSVSSRASLAFTNGAVVDVRTGRLLAGSTVLITRNRIVAVGPAFTIRMPAGTHVVDVRGKYIIPGLTDTHVHLFADDWINTPVDTPAYFGWILAGGVTSIREMSVNGFTHVPLRAAIQAGRLLAPRLYLSAGPDRSVPDPWSPILQGVGTNNVALAIQRLREIGIDGLKLSQNAPRADMLSIVTTAQAARIPVYGHTVFRAPDGRIDNLTLDLVRAGLNGVVHPEGTVSRPGVDARPFPEAPRTTPEGRRAWVMHYQTAWQSLSDQDMQSLIDSMVARRVWYEPTRLVIHYWWNLPDYDRRNLSPHHRWSTDPSGQSTGLLREVERQAEDAQARFIKRFYEAGGMLLTGTDEVPFPPWGVTEEMRLLVNAGVPPLAALQAATINAARALGWDDRLGAVETGKLADLVLLDANPLDDITNVRRIHAVVADGQLLDRVTLDEFLARAGTPAAKR